MFYHIVWDEKKNRASIFNAIKECVPLTISFHLYFFSSKNLCFYYFHFFFWWSIKFGQQNINQSETGTDDKKLSVELYAKHRNIVYTLMITYSPHFDDYIKCKWPSHMMVCDEKFTKTGIFIVYRKTVGLEVSCCFVLPFFNVC